MPQTCHEVNDKNPENNPLPLKVNLQRKQSDVDAETLFHQVDLFESFVTRKARQFDT
jgi:hypothetical protein